MTNKICPLTICNKPLEIMTTNTHLEAQYPHLPIQFVRHNKVFIFFHLSSSGDEQWLLHLGHRKQKPGLVHMNVHGFSFVISPHAQHCCPQIFLSASKNMSILSVGTKQSEDITMALLSQNWKWLNNNNVVHRVHFYCHLMSVLPKLVKVWMYIYQDTCKRPS